MLQTCAEYHVHLEAFPNSTPKSFVKLKMCQAIDGLAKDKIDADGFLFLCRCYTTFLQNYQDPTVEEQLRMNLKELNDPQMVRALICLARTPSGRPDAEQQIPDNTFERKGETPK